MSASLPTELRFHHDGRTPRVVFGRGSRAAVADELTALGITRPALLATAEQGDLARDIAATVPDCAGVWATAVPHTPTDVSDATARAVLAAGADGLVAVGGGSTTGLAKAIARRTGLPQVIVPTTFAGSEMTPILGETEDGRKRTVRDAALQPATVLYDPELLATLPARVGAASALNAIAHATEALYAPGGSPLLRLTAEHAVSVVAAGLRDTDADELLYGAWLCGTCLAGSTMGLHHKLCHVLGGTFDLPHAETHAIVLGHVVAFNAPAAPEAVAALRRALGTEDPAVALFELARDLGLPTGLGEIGMPADGIDEVVRLALDTPYANPREPEPGALSALLHAAHAGRPPRPV